MKKRGLIRKIIVYLLTAAVFAGLLYFVYNYLTYGGREAAAETAPRGEPLTAKRADIREIITSVGVVYLESAVNVNSESAERVKEVFFETDDFISAGQTVVTYDVSETVTNLTRRLAEAEIAVENAELVLRGMSLPKTGQEMRQYENAVTSAEKSVFDAEMAVSSAERDIESRLTDLARAEAVIETNLTLLAADAVTNDEYLRSVSARDDIQTAIEKLGLNLKSSEMNLLTAKTNLERAVSELERAGETLAEEADRIRYRQQENSVRSAEITRDDIKRQLNSVVYQTVSETGGTVTSVSAEKGKAVPPGNALITVADFNNLIVRADVSEFDAPKIKTGQNAFMYSDGIQGAVYEGAVRKIASAANSRNAGGGTETVVGIEISVANADGILKPGYNLDIEIVTAERLNVITVPQTAVTRDNQSKTHYVFKVDENLTAWKTTVVLGLYGDIDVEIISGLNEGERYVDSPQPYLEDGMSINYSPEGQNRRGGPLYNVGGLIPTPRRQ